LVCSHRRKTRPPAIPAFAFSF